MLFNVKIIILGFLIYIYRKNKIILEMSKCYIIKWWNVKKKYMLFSGLVLIRKIIDYFVKFFGIYFVICWYLIVKYIK